MERIEITDERLAARVERIVSDLRTYYPEGFVYNLEKLHKSLAERISDVRKQLGYESRKDFLAAYGFTVGFPEGKGNKGGRRPVHTKESVEELLAELRRRYADGRKKPCTLQELIAQNPDLKTKIVGGSERSKRFFGEGLPSILRSRGILGEREDPNPGELRAQADAMVEDLRSRYEGASSKPTSMSELKGRHPEYAKELRLLGTMSEEAYGMAAVAFLRSVGVIGKKGPASMSDDRVEVLLADLAAQFGKLAAEEKPAGWSALIKLVGDRGKELREAKTSWEKGHEGKFVDELQRRGIMPLTAVNERKFLVRNASPADLVALWGRFGMPSLVVRGGEHDALLPECVVAVDVARRIQVEASVTSFATWKLPEQLASQPYPKDLSVCVEAGELRVVSPSEEVVLKKGVSSSEELKQAMDAAKDSPAMSGLDAVEVLGVSEPPCGLRKELGAFLVQARVPLAKPLTAPTMLHMLCAAGIITDDDLRGGFDWHYRAPA